MTSRLSITNALIQELLNEHTPRSIAPARVAGILQRINDIIADVNSYAENKFSIINDNIDDINNSNALLQQSLSNLSLSLAAEISEAKEDAAKAYDEADKLLVPVCVRLSKGYSDDAPAKLRYSVLRHRAGKRYRLQVKIVSKSDTDPINAGTPIDPNLPLLPGTPDSSISPLSDTQMPDASSQAVMPDFTLGLVFDAVAATEIPEDADGYSGIKYTLVNIEKRADAFFLNFCTLSVTYTEDFSEMYAALSPISSESISHKQPMLEDSDDIFIDGSQLFLTDEAKATKLVDSEDINISDDNELLLTDEAKRRVFIDLWKKACVISTATNNDTAVGGYDESTGRFWLGAVNDITYDEAVAGLALTDRRNCNCRRLMAPVFPPIYYDSAPSSFEYCWSVRVMALSSFRGYLVCSASQSWVNCRKLEEIVGVLDFSAVTKADPFQACYMLQRLNITGLKRSVSFSNSPLLSLESLQYMVANAANAEAITITVHASVFAKLTGEGDDEWNALAQAAAEKNIQFATA